MQIYKFGGASLKDAPSVENVARIVRQCENPVVVVASAMGKTTTALELLTDAYFHNQDYLPFLEQIKAFHLAIAHELFKEKDHPVFKELEKIFDRLANLSDREPSLHFDYEYDQIVSYGEIISTKILSHYLNYTGTPSSFVDIRKYLKTDETYREGKIDVEQSTELMAKRFKFENERIYVTQGFIASSSADITTTLGRDGSDFTAAMLALFLKAENVTIWKDVCGVYNADPKFYANPISISQLSYREAVELAYYGAKVIHPKTIKPLQNMNIPLYVKSFLEPEHAGTIVSNFTELRAEGLDGVPSIFIFKTNQILISISPIDFSFIAEENLSKIFAWLAKYRLKANMMQNSAISFSVCVDNDEKKVSGFIKDASSVFKIKYNDQLELITIRHYNPQSVMEVTENRQIILQEKSRQTARFVVR